MPAWLQYCFLIVGKLLYNVVLVSGVQHESVMIIYTYRWSLSAGLGSPSHTKRLDICFMHGTVYVSKLLSQCAPLSPSSAVSTGQFSTRVPSFPANTFISSVFLDFMDAR